MAQWIPHLSCKTGDLGLILGTDLYIVASNNGSLSLRPV